MGKKEKTEFVQPIVKKYKVEVLNRSSNTARVIIGNQGHSMETLIKGNMQWPAYWEIEFTDVPDIKLFGPNNSPRKSFGLRESHASINSFVVQDDCIICKNENPLLPRNTTASPEIFGTDQEEHIEVLKNSSRKDCSYFIGDDWHNIAGTLDSGNAITWKLVISQLPKMITHHWCKIDELGSRRNKFSVVGCRTIIDGEEVEDLVLNYRDHVFEINDSWELLRDGRLERLWKFDWE